MRPSLGLVLVVAFLALEPELVSASTSMKPNPVCKALTSKATLGLKIAGGVVATIGLALLLSPVENRVAWGLSVLGVGLALLVIGLVSDRMCAEARRGTKHHRPPADSDTMIDEPSPPHTPALFGAANEHDVNTSADADAGAGNHTTSESDWRVGDPSRADGADHDEQHDYDATSTDGSSTTTADDVDSSMSADGDDSLDGPSNTTTPMETILTMSDLVKSTSSTRLHREASVRRRVWAHMAASTDLPEHPDVSAFLGAALDMTDSFRSPPAPRMNVESMLTRADELATVLTNTMQSTAAEHVPKFRESIHQLQHTIVPRLQNFVAVVTHMRQYYFIPPYDTKFAALILQELAMHASDDEITASLDPISTQSLAPALTNALNSETLRGLAQSWQHLARNPTPRQRVVFAYECVQHMIGMLESIQSMNIPADIDRDLFEIMNGVRRINMRFYLRTLAPILQRPWRSLCREGLVIFTSKLERARDMLPKLKQIAQSVQPHIQHLSPVVDQCGASYRAARLFAPMVSTAVNPHLVKIHSQARHMRSRVSLEDQCGCGLTEDEHQVALRDLISRLQERVQAAGGAMGKGARKLEMFLEAVLARAQTPFQFSSMVACLNDVVDRSDPHRLLEQVSLEGLNAPKLVKDALSTCQGSPLKALVKRISTFQDLFDSITTTGFSAPLYRGYDWDKMIAESCGADSTTHPLTSSECDRLNEVLHKIVSTLVSQYDSRDQEIGDIGSQLAHLVQLADAAESAEQRDPCDVKSLLPTALAVTSFDTGVEDWTPGQRPEAQYTNDGLEVKGLVLHRMVAKEFQTKVESQKIALQAAWTDGDESWIQREEAKLVLTQRQNHAMGFVPSDDFVCEFLKEKPVQSTVVAFALPDEKIRSILESLTIREHTLKVPSGKTFDWFLEFAARYRYSPPPEDFSGYVDIEFLGAGEDGADAGGLSRQFYDQLSNDIVKAGVVRQPDPTSPIMHFAPSAPAHVCRAVGYLMAMAANNGHVMAVNFPLVYFRQLLGEDLQLTDLVELNQMTSLESYYDMYDKDDWKDNAHYQLDMELDNPKEDMRLFDTPLQFAQFLTDLVARKHVTVPVDVQLNAWMDGFQTLTNDQMDLYRHMGAARLRQFVFWSESELDDDMVSDWVQSITFSSATDSASVEESQRAMLAEYIRGESNERKRELLFFWTGSSVIPPKSKGFKSLKLMYELKRTSSDHLPVAHTCSNALDVPEYASVDQMRAKFNSAIEMTGSAMQLV